MTIPVDVQTALTAMAVDALAVAGLVLAVTVAVYGVRFLRIVILGMTALQAIGKADRFFRTRN